MIPIKKQRKNNRKDVALKRDLELLYVMYRKRALSTAQVMLIRKISESYVYDKLDELRGLGYISSKQISGNYILNQKRQGSYHKIKNKGIRLLKKKGYQVDHVADDLRVSKYRLPYLLLANDISISLENTSWGYRDSREIKNVHGLNRNDTLQGSLINPSKTKEYALYIFLSKTRPDTLKKIKKEIDRNDFGDILVLTRGSDSFNSTIDAFTDKNDRLIKGGSIKVLPFSFANSYLNLSIDNPRAHRHLIQELGIEILADSSNENAFQSNKRFDYLVRYSNEEKYFIDLLDNDLMKIEEIKRYRKEEYQRDGRKVLALTNQRVLINLHKRLLGDIKHVEFYPVDPDTVKDFANDLPNKKHFWKSEERR